MVRYPKKWQIEVRGFYSECDTLYEAMSEAIQHFKDGFIKQDLSEEDFEEARTRRPFVPQERLWLDSDMEYFLRKLEYLPSTVAPQFRPDNGYVHDLRIERRLDTYQYTLYYQAYPSPREKDKLQMGYLRTLNYTDRNGVTKEFDILAHTVKRCGLEQAESYYEQAKCLGQLYRELTPRFVSDHHKVSFFKDEHTWLCSVATGSGSLVSYGHGPVPTLAAQACINRTDGAFLDDAFVIDNIILDVYDSWHETIREDDFNRLFIEISKPDTAWVVRTYLDHYDMWQVYDELIESDERLDYAMMKMIEARRIHARRVQEGLEWANKHKLPSSSSAETESFSYD
jgi:hypothetical protein